jgi:type I restriction enzyme M protein
VPLLDAYDVYQHLMDYAAETMEDDAYRIAEAGWVEAAKPQLIVEDKARKTKARPDITIGRRKYQAELIPPALLIACYFAKEQAAIEALEVSRAALEQQMEEMAEEQGGEGGLLEEAKTDKDKLTKASVMARLKEIRTDRDAADERQAVQAYLALMEKEAEIAAKLKASEDALMEKVLAKYAKLTEEDIKALVVDDKWLTTIGAAVQGELNLLSQALTGRVRQLAERYAVPLPELTNEIATLAHRVDAHLKKMGMSWN